ncbi:hypothetical protein, partial [Mixta calida]|uniref:hypothetical protein n=1 Tax=Mixta calida TaxID=665913 RepID=UPI0028ACAC15
MIGACRRFVNGRREKARRKRRVKGKSAPPTHNARRRQASGRDDAGFFQLIKQGEEGFARRAVAGEAG